MADLPLGWQSATIEELCSFSNGHGFRPNDWSSKGLPIIRIQNLNGSEQFNYFTGEPEDDWIVEPETILFAWAGTRGVSFGPTIWNGPRGVLNQHIFKVHPKEDVDRVWLVSILRVITERIERRAHGFKATLVHVRKEDITSQIIRVPPLSEQRKIAQILSTWDEAIATALQLIAALQRRKKGLMQQLLTGQVRFPEFGNTPWEDVEIGDYLRPVTRAEKVEAGKDYRLIGVRWYLAGAHIHDVVPGDKMVTQMLSRVEENDILYNKMWVSKAAFAVAKKEHAGAYGSGEDRPSNRWLP